MLRKYNIVGVMGSGKKPQTELTEPLGQALATLPIHLLTGGGFGVMHSISKAFTSVADRQGLCLGCIPTRERNGHYVAASKSYPNQFVELPIYTPLDVFTPEKPDAITRNYINIMTSNVVIALPGGRGTKQEVQLACRFNKPILLYGMEKDFLQMPEGLDRVTTPAAAIQWVSAKLGLN